MSKITFKAKTVEEAINKAIIEMQVTSDKLGYEVKQSPTKGFFGIGAKECILEAFIKQETPKEAVVEESVDVEDEIKEVCVKEVISSNVLEATKIFLEDIAQKMGVKAEVKVEAVDTACIKAEIVGDNLQILIGKEGVTLDSIQYLASRVASKQNVTYVKVKLDAGNYREGRRKALEKLAKKAAKNAYENREKVKMKSMNAYDRRLVHACLQSDDRVKTLSEGSEPYRYIVVSPVK